MVGVNRQSLEVPGSETSSPDSGANGDATGAHGRGHAGLSSFAMRAEIVDTPLEKRNSLGRSGAARFSGGPGFGRRIPVVSSGGDLPTRARGVTLEDKPMDD